MIVKPRSILMYGVSGSSKTSQCYHLAKWIYKTTGKRLRLIYSDGGGFSPFLDSGMIERGEVEVFDYSYRQYALSDWRKLSEGYFPRLDTKGGEFFQKVEECKVGLDQVGGYIIEGLTSASEVLKTHCSNQKEGVGFKESWRYEEEGEVITGLTQGHYGIVQKEIYSSIMRGFNNLPVPYLIFTALLGKGEDKQSRETVYGPQTAGTAQVGQVNSWVMDSLHLSKERYKSYNQQTKVFGDEVEGLVAWFEQHPDSQTGVPCLAKARIMPELYEKLKQYFPYGHVPLSYTRGIVDYFMVLEHLKKGYEKNGQT